MINYRNIKGDVQNSYRTYKMLYYTIFDGIGCALFLTDLHLKSIDDIPLPPDWDKLSDSDKINGHLRTSSSGNSDLPVHRAIR